MMDSIDDVYNNTNCDDNIQPVVYYYCKNTKRIAVLQKLDSTITNENRKYIIDSKNASYRANILKLIKIIASKKELLAGVPHDSSLDTLTNTIDKFNTTTITIPYRIAPRNSIFCEYSVGQIVKLDKQPFNKHSMYFGIPYYTNFKRAQHAYLLSVGMLPHISNVENNYKIYDTYDSFGKQIEKSIDNETGEEVFALTELMEPLFVIAEKKLNKAANYILSFIEQ